MLNDIGLHRKYSQVIIPSEGIEPWPSNFMPLQGVHDSRHTCTIMIESWKEKNDLHDGRLSIISLGHKIVTSRKKVKAPPIKNKTK